MAITTAKERKQRRQEALELLANGHSPTAVVSQLTDRWGVSRRTSLRDLALAQDALVMTVDTATLQSLTAWCCASYQRLATAAEAQKNYGAAVAALNGLCRLLIEPALEAQANRRTRHGNIRR